MLSSALLASAGGDRVTILGRLEPAWPGARAVGPAFTVRGVAGDNLALHLAVAQGAPGDVIVAALAGEREAGHCGDLIARAAAVGGVRGIVIDAGIRDRATIAELGFPLFHRGTCPRAASKTDAGELGVPIELDGAHVSPGDLVCADDDGVVVVPAADVDEVVAAALALAAREHEYEQRIAAGESTLDIFDLRGRAA